MSAPATQPQQHEQQKKKQSESPGEEALKKNTDCVYFLASPSTCKKGAECEYRHSEYARVNPRDCYYWLNGNCLNPKCGFRHPALGGLITGSVPPPSQAAVKQPFPCVFFQKGMCAKGDLCPYMHTPPSAVAGYKKQHPVEAKPAAAVDPLFSKKPVDVVDVSVAPRVTPALRDGRGGEGYVPKRVGYEPVVEKIDVGFHNGKDADDVLRESSPGFDVFVDNEARDSEYYHVGDGYGRRSQEGRSSLNEYDADFSAVVDQRFDSYDRREDRHAWGGHRRGSSERGDRLERRVYGESEGSENMLASDLRYRLANKQRKGNDYAAPEASVERGYRDSRRSTPRESSISCSSRLQGRIKLRERSDDDEGRFGRRAERGRDRSDLSQSRIRDRVNGRSEENQRDVRAPWVRRRETEEGFSVSKGIAETKSSKKEDGSKTETSLGKRKSLEEDHHPYKRSGDSFAAPLPFSEILKRKRAAASGASIENKEETISKEKGGDVTELITEEKTEVVSEPNPTHEAGLEEGTVMEEGEEVNGEEEEQVHEEEEQVYEEEEQAYEGDELNGEYYYEEDGEYAYEEGEEVVYVAEEGEEATEGGEAEGEEDIEKKTAGMLS